MWAGNLMLIVINLPLIGIWVSLLRVPYRLMFPAIILFCCIGAYSLNNTIFDVWIMLLFGIIGVFFIKVGAEPAPFILGFVLGPMMEEYFRRAMNLSKGDPTVFVTRPISACLLLLAAILLLILILPSVRSQRDTVFRE
jgi:putative tricarboxylic transport membrane protein